MVTIERHLPGRGIYLAPVDNGFPGHSISRILSIIIIIVITIVLVSGICRADAYSGPSHDQRLSLAVIGGLRARRRSRESLRFPSLATSGILLIQVHGKGWEKSPRESSDLFGLLAIILRQMLTVWACARDVSMR